VIDRGSEQLSQNASASNLALDEEAGN